MSNKVKKVLFFFIIVLVSPIIGGTYGILNDQISVSISPEYYTKFKFYQFGVSEFYNGSESSIRALTIYIGWMATWWMGLLIGAILSFVGLIIKDAKEMLQTTFKSVFITIVTTFIMSLIGLGCGYFIFSNKPMKESRRYNIEQIENKKLFVTVGSMHNFSYLGGLIGMIGGVMMIVRKKKKTVL